MYPVRGGNVLLPYSVQGLLERTRVLGTLEVRSSVHMPTASQPLSHDNGYVVQKARLGSTITDYLLVVLYVHRTVHIYVLYREACYEIRMYSVSNYSIWLPYICTYSTQRLGSQRGGTLLLRKLRARLLLHCGAPPTPLFPGTVGSLSQHGWGVMFGGKPVA